MLAGEYQSPHHIENMEFQITFYVKNNPVRPSRHFQYFAESLFCLFLFHCRLSTLAYTHYHLGTSSVQFSFCIFMRMMLVQQVSVDSRQCQETGKIKTLQFTECV